MSSRTFWSVLPALALLFATSAQAQIKIGVAGPFTGDDVAFGAQFKNGAAEAVEDINRMGGIQNQRLILELGDDASDEKRGVEVAKRFAAARVSFVVGHFNSGVTLPASKVYLEHNILEITPAATNVEITERGLWNMFRTCGRDDQQGAAAASYLARFYKDKKIAIVHDNTPYGQGLAEETKKALIRRGIHEVLFDGVTKGQEDFSALIAKIRVARVDLLYWGGLHTESGRLAQQMHAAGLEVVMMGGDGLTTQEFANIGGPAVEGTLMTFSPDPRKRPEAKALVEKFRAKRFEPEAYTLYSYAAVQVIKQAAEASKSIEPKTVAEQMLTGMRFRTVIGDLSFDKKGDITRFDWVMYIWKKQASGKITYQEIQ